MKNFIRRYPLGVFYVLTFLISWLGWIPQALYNRGLFPFDHPLFSILGGGGPTLAAVIVTWVLGGREAPKSLLNKLFRWKVRWIWFVFPLAYWGLVSALMVLIADLLGLTMLSLRNYAWHLLPAIFAALLLSNLWEEVGWRGFALPRLQERFSDQVVVLIMGLAWSLWHLPLMLDPNSPMSRLPWMGEIVFSLALTVIYTWLYNQSEGSLVPVALFHALSNTAGFLLLELGIFLVTYRWVVSLTSLAAGILLVLHWGQTRVGGTPRGASRDHQAVSDG